MANNDLPVVAPVPRLVSSLSSNRRHVLEPSNEYETATRSDASDSPRHRRPGSTGSDPMSIESSPPRPTVSPPRSPTSAPNISFFIRVQIGREYREEVELMRVHTNMSCAELVTRALRALRPNWTSADRSSLHRAIRLSVLWNERGQSTVVRPGNVRDVLEFVDQRNGEDLLYCVVVPHSERIGLDPEDDELRRSWNQCKASYPDFF